jgi:hypothetical protein
MCNMLFLCILGMAFGGMDIMDIMDRMDILTPECRMKEVMCDDKQEVKSEI